MKPSLSLFLVFASFYFPVGAQNLVANNGFESFVSLPTGPGEWWRVSGWNNVNNQAVFAWPYASPDYLSLNGSGQAHLPGSVFGNVNPYAGNAVMGFVAYYNPGAADFREYISRPLNQPMVTGQQYAVSFMMTNGFSNQYCGSGCNHVGVHFSLAPLSQLQHEPINAVPQCEINTVWWSTSWQLVSFVFTAAADYRYLTIGNFYDDASTSHTVFNMSSTSSYGAYYFIDEVIVQPVAPLPVELLSFYGENNNNVNRLHWETASEINNDYFDVEKSLDGKNFTRTGSVDGHGNSMHLLNYAYADPVSVPATWYYRLKQVDYDGNSAYSRTISIGGHPGINHVQMAYNQEYEIVKLYWEGTKNGTVKIIDFSGRLLDVYPVEIEQREIEISLNSYRPGLLIISFSGTDESSRFKIFKR